MLKSDCMARDLTLAAEVFPGHSFGYRNYHLCIMHPDVALDALSRMQVRSLQERSQTLFNTASLVTRMY